MSEPVEIEPVEPEAEVTPPAPKPADPAKPAESVDWKSRSRDWEKRAKDNADAAKRLAELEESQKTEAQKDADARAADRAAREEAESRALKFEIASDFGVGKDYFDLLGTGDEEAIKGRAERVGGLLKLATENEDLKAQLEALQQGKPSNGRPVPNLKPGATPEQNDPEETEYAQYAARFRR